MKNDGFSQKTNNVNDRFAPQSESLRLLDELPTMIWRSRLEDGCDFFNRSWLEFTGRSLEQELGEGWTENIHPEDRQRCLKLYRKAFARRQPIEIEFRLRHHSGDYRWVHDTGKPFLDEKGSLAGFIGSCYDLTERREAFQTIQEREKLLTTAALAASLVFFKVDRQGIIQLMLGQSLSRQLDNVDPVGKSIDEVYRNIPKVREGVQRALAGETVTLVIETNGLIYETTYAPMPDEQGEITSVVGVASDVTGHRRVEEALRESEVHFHTIFNDTILGIKLVDFEGHILESNPALQEMLGYSSEELQHMSFLVLTHPEDLSIMQQSLESLMRGDVDHFRLEKRYLRKDGQVVWGRLAMSLVRGQNGQPLYGIGMIENITAQKVAEAELAEMQRRLIDSAELERLRLSQDLHDGPLQDLQAISMQISFLEGLVNGPEGETGLQNLQEEMRKVTRALRSLCGELRPPALAPFGLEPAIRSHVEHLLEQHPELAVHLQLKSDGKALSERVRLALFRIYQHSIANILRHAQAKNVWITFDLDENQILLKIRDDGQGFPVPRRWIQLVRQGHFGLVGAIERAESVGGRMGVNSSPGAGTEITVTVPRLEEEQVAVKERITANFRE